MLITQAIVKAEELDFLNQMKTSQPGLESYRMILRMFAHLIMKESFCLLKVKTQTKMEL